MLQEFICSAPMQARGGNYHRLSVAWRQRKDLLQLHSLRKFFAYFPRSFEQLMQNIVIWWLLDVLGNSTTLRAGAWKRPENCRVWWWQWQALGIIGLVCLGIALTCRGRALCCRKVKALGGYSTICAFWYHRKIIIHRKHCFDLQNNLRSREEGNYTELKPSNIKPKELISDCAGLNCGWLIRRHSIVHMFSILMWQLRTWLFILWSYSALLPNDIWL